MPHHDTFTLTPTPPFDARHTLRRLESFRASALPRTFERGGATLALAVAGKAVLATLHPRGTPPEQSLEVTLRGAEPLPEAQLDQAKDRLRLHLGLDLDLADLYRIGQQDPAFGQVLEALHGFHPVLHTTPFEAAVWALVQQRTPNSFAYQTMARLAELLGPSIDDRGRRYLAFPEPATLLDEAGPALLEATNNTRKVERLLPLAAAFAGIDETFLRTAPYDEVAAWLGKIHGLGRWSSDYVLLRGLARGERTPWSDTGLLEAISRVYTRGFTISRGDARELAEGYRWWQGWWAHYLKVFVYSYGSNY